MNAKLTRLISRSFVLLALLFATTAFSQTSIGFNVFYNTAPGQSSYYIQAPIATANTVQTYYEIISPHTNFESTLDHTGSRANSTFVNITAFDDLINEITNGNWAFITDVGSSSQQTYFFHITAAGFTSNSMPPFQITNPTPEQANVSSNVTFTWSEVTNYNQLNVYVYDSTGGYFQGTSFFDPPATAFIPDQPLAGGDTNYFFNVSYTTDASNIFAISTPSITLEPAFPNWSSTSTLNLTEQIHFTSGTPSVTNAGQLVAHYAFDNSLNVGQDTSGNGYDLDFNGSPQGGGVLDNTNAIAGGGAAYFDGGSFLSYTATPAPVLAAFAGNFTLSFWISTTQNFGNDSDEGYDGAGLVTADIPISTDDLVPASLTGHKIAFNTGPDDDTLHSSATVNDGAYHHIVITRDQSTGLKQIYLDGAFDSSDTATTDSLNQPKNLSIGSKIDASQTDPSTAATGNYFQGNLDDLQIYSRVLSPAEIAFLHQNPGNVLGAPPTNFPPVSVNLTLLISRNREGTNDTFSAFPGFFSSSPQIITSDVITSPHKIFSSRTHSGGSVGGSSTLPSLDSLLQECTNGQWTLTINQNDPSQQTFNFTVSIIGLTTNILVPVSILVPPNGATNIPNDTPLQWSGPLNTPLNADVGLIDGTGGIVHTNFGPNATNWPSPPALFIGTSFFDVDYSLGTFTGVSISVPANSSGQQVSNFVYSASLTTFGGSEFVVSSTAIAPARLTNLQITNGNLQFAFTPAAGRTNVIQYSTNLATSVWLPYTNLIGNGASANISIPITAGSQKFFRVITH